MTRLHPDLLALAALTGDYAVLMLIISQLTDFVVATVICAGALITASQVVYADRQKPQGDGAGTKGRLGTT